MLAADLFSRVRFVGIRRVLVIWILYTVPVDWFTGTVTNVRLDLKINQRNKMNIQIIKGLV